jgi:hypothetical protein
MPEPLRGLCRLAEALGTLEILECTRVERILAAAACTISTVQKLPSRELRGVSTNAGAQQD